MKKILCVDDERDILKVFSGALSRKGYEVVTTQDPTRMTELMGQQPDLVTLDVQMPVRDGFDLFNELKRSGRATPILFITAHPNAFEMSSKEKVEMWQRDFADGNTDILYKPFTLDTLYEKVESLIGLP
jgi:two-component system OmpR family response regulator